MVFISFKTPDTDDGRITGSAVRRQGGHVVEAEFDLSEEFIDRVAGRYDRLIFVARSRIAQLGINIKPVDGLEVAGGRAFLRLFVQALIRPELFNGFIARAFVPGLKIGRLVFLDPRKRLTSDDVFEAKRKNELLLPAPFSVEADGLVSFGSHRRIYQIKPPLTFEEFLTIITRIDGKYILKRLFESAYVDDIEIGPNEAIITSCSMFLHKHFVVLNTTGKNAGEHFTASVLDPHITRGSRIFLEFLNPGRSPISNPRASATIYRADEDTKSLRGAYHLPRLASLGSIKRGGGPRYYERPVTLITQNPQTGRSRALQVGDQYGLSEREHFIGSLIARDEDEVREARKTKLDAAFAGLNRDGETTALFEYFPNHAEHLALCNAAIQRKIRHLVFRKASFEHGPFLSMRDHCRLSDYRDLGVEVFWKNAWLGHMAKHVFRRSRGYFVPVANVAKFQNAFILAIYGSTMKLPAAEIAKMSRLVDRLGDLFRYNLAVMTGGGPGAMMTVSDIARPRGILTGASFLEIENWEKETNPNADFYQTFQFNERHLRQRWFEIANLHLFMIGGLGTLEEIGLTLTDMKLGVVDEGPVVFWGKDKSQLYWSELGAQLNKIFLNKRGPSWINKNLLFTDDPEEVVAFYKSVFSIG